MKKYKKKYLFAYNIKPVQQNTWGWGNAYYTVESNEKNFLLSKEAIDDIAGKIAKEVQEEFYYSDEPGIVIMNFMEVEVDEEDEA